MRFSAGALFAAILVASVTACSNAAFRGESSAPLPHSTVAFPGAEGFGALATGGRGCPVVHVSNLDNAGPGSFREAVSQGKRTVVFDVGGVVTLESSISFPSDITIEGQTAPGEGITIYNNACSITGQSNIIIRYVRFRAGMASARGSKTLGINASHNVMLDHLTISWGRWDNTGMTARAVPKTRGTRPAAPAKGVEKPAEGGDEEQEAPAQVQRDPDALSHDITMQDCMISEGLDPQRFGALIDEAMHVTVCRCLWIDNNSRNPKAKGYIQVINDVVYNWEVGGLVGGHSAATWHEDYLGNLFIAGPNSKDHSALPMYTHTDNVYAVGNMIDLDRDGTLNPRPITAGDFRGNGEGQAPTFVSEPFNHPRVPVTVMSATDAYKHVVEDVGASLHRDVIDQRIVGHLTSLGKTGAIIHDEKDVGGIQPVAGGTTPVDSDHDGIPDAWETAHHLDPHNAADASRVDPSSGYSGLELYANSLVPEAKLKAVTGKAGGPVAATQPAASAVKP